MRAIAGRQRLHLAGCAWFWGWALLGAAAALGALSLGPLLTSPSNARKAPSPGTSRQAGSFAMVSSVPSFVSAR